MDLKYIRENEIHEKYLLNKLNASEKTVYEAFLKENPEAMQELEQTKKLLSSIRSIGNQAMRREIEEQVTDIKNPKTDWTMLYRAAAVLFLFAILPAVVYYNVYVLNTPIPSEEIFIKESIKDAKQQETEVVDNTGEEAEISMEEVRVPFETKNGRLLDKTEETSLPTLSSSREDIEIVADDIPGSGSGTGAEPIISARRSAAGKKAIQDKLRQNVISTESDKSIETTKGISIAESEPLEIQEMQINESTLGANEQSGYNPYSIKSAAQAQPAIAPNLSKKPRELKIDKEGKSLLINFVNTYQSRLTDSLIIQVTGDTLNYMVEIYLPEYLYIINENDIHLDWEEESILITFKDEWFYKFRINKNDKYALRVINGK